MLKKLKNKLLKKYIKKTPVFNHGDAIIIFQSILITPISLLMLFEGRSMFVYGFALTAVALCGIIRSMRYFSLKKYQKKEDVSGDFTFNLDKKEIINLVNLDYDFFSTIKQKIMTSEENFDDMQVIISAIKKELTQEEIEDILVNKNLLDEVERDGFKTTNTLYLFKFLDAAIKKIEDRDRLKQYKDDVKLNALKDIMNNIESFQKVSVGGEFNIKKTEKEYC